MIGGWMAAVLVCAVLVLAAAAGCAGQAQVSQQVIMDMDTVQFSPGVFGEEDQPVGTVEAAEGRSGSACRFNFVEGASNGYFSAEVEAGPAWEEAEGISFWVKGDGSDSWGGLELVDTSDYALRYGYAFPITSTEWVKITVPWCDLIPILPAGSLVDSENGYRPSGFGHVRFGKGWYWREFPANSFTVDEMALEESIPLDETDYTPAEAGLPRARARLEAGEPVTMVTMGDSLSDKRHWANRELLWSEVVVERLAGISESEVTLVNPALGGSQLTQGLIHMPLWLGSTPRPDVVTVWFGGNDWEDGMRGEHYREVLRFAVDRIRRLTGGQSEVLLIASIPDLAGWEEREELAEAVREVAAEKRTGLADVAAAFHRVGDEEEEARRALYAWDEVHLGELGHQLAAQVVLEAVAGEQ